MTRAGRVFFPFRWDSSGESNDPSVGGAKVEGARDRERERFGRDFARASSLDGDTTMAHGVRRRDRPCTFSSSARTRADARQVVAPRDD